jgi:hypothetical protein
LPGQLSGAVKLFPSPDSIYACTIIEKKRERKKIMSLINSYSFDTFKQERLKQNRVTDKYLTLVVDWLQLS